MAAVTPSTSQTYPTHFEDEQSARQILSRAYSDLQGKLDAKTSLDPSRVRELEELAGRVRLFLCDNDYANHLGPVVTSPGFSYYARNISVVHPRELFYKNNNDAIYNFLCAQDRDTTATERASDIAQVMKTILESHTPSVGMQNAQEKVPMQSILDTVVATPVRIITIEKQIDPCLRSIASKAMTKLLTWRNSVFESATSRFRMFCRIAAVQIAQPVIATIALVESVVYRCLLLGSQVLEKEKSQKEESEEQKVYKRLLDSSSFTLTWTLASSLYYNLSFSPIVTDEAAMKKRLTS